MPVLLPEIDDGTESDCNTVQFALLRQSVRHGARKNGGGGRVAPVHIIHASEL